MAKDIRKDGVHGLSAAAGFLACAESIVLRHADSGRLRCTRDNSGKRLFKLIDLEKFKCNH